MSLLISPKRLTHITGVVLHFSDTQFSGFCHSSTSRSLSAFSVFFLSCLQRWQYAAFMSAFCQRSHPGTSVDLWWKMRKRLLLSSLCWLTHQLLCPSCDFVRSKMHPVLCRWDVFLRAPEKQDIWVKGGMGSFLYRRYTKEPMLPFTQMSWFSKDKEYEQGWWESSFLWNVLPQEYLEAIVSIPLHPGSSVVQEGTPPVGPPLLIRPGRTRLMSQLNSISGGHSPKDNVVLDIKWWHLGIG